MTLYQPSRSVRSSPLFFLIAFLIAVSTQTVSSGAQVRVLDAVSKSGFEHFYSMEYDQAIQDFQKGLKDNPDDPNRLNYLLEAILFRELYKCNALDTRLYTHQRFITDKEITMDAAVKKQIKDLADRSISISDQRIKSNSQDVQAIYSRGVAEGLRSTYLAVVEHSWWSALRNALAARHDHEQVLKMQPGFTDAKTIVGAHNYVIGSLPLPIKIMAGMTGIRGDKNKGLEYLAEAGKAGGESSADARAALGLFLRREGRFQEALDNLHTLTRDYPRNFLFALEEGHLLMDAAKPVEAAVAYRKVLIGCKEGRYPNARTEMAQFALGEALRIRGQNAEALQAFTAAGAPDNKDRNLRQRALLAAGEVADLLFKRDVALERYQATVAIDSSTEEAEMARKHLNRPYTRP